MNVARFFVIMLTATVKTLLTPPVAFAANMGFWETFAAVTLGGIISFCVFFFCTDIVMRLTSRKVKNHVKRARRIITMKRKYRLGVFLFLLPFTSVPVMAVIVRKFYAHSKPIFFASLGIITFWCMVFCLASSPLLKV